MNIEWKDRSNEDDGEQYRFLIPNVILADLWHAEYEDFGESINRWRLNLAKHNADGELVTADHDLEEGVAQAEAKAWAEPLIKEFTT